MSNKKQRMQAFAAAFHNEGGWDPRYWGFFVTFNQGRYFEAHDVLEDLWLECRGQALDTFYKALIQLAGVFVHLEKGRPRPALALMALAQAYLRQHGDDCQGIALEPLHGLIHQWRQRVLEANAINLREWPAPHLPLPKV